MRNKFSAVSDPSKFFTNPGEDVCVEYSPELLPDGTVRLTPSGKHSMTEFINSYKDSTDISYILKQLALGNDSVLNSRVGMFGDFTEMPKTYAEVLQLQINARDYFDKLPVEQKQKFNNNFNEFFVSLGSEEWFSKLGIDNKSVEELVVEKESSDGE